MSEKKEPRISLRQVTKNFDVKSQVVSVLKGVDVDIYPGELVIVFGPSGSGKSTMLHIMLGLEYPSSGSIEFLGKRMDLSSEDETAEIRKNEVGIIYQQPNWIRSISVISNVAFPLLLRGETKQSALVKAREMLEKVGMSKWAGYFPAELSSGQQQKIALARSLVTEPPIIFADEPTGNLDFKSSDDLMRLFHELTKQGKTIVMVSHNLDNLEYADTVLQFLDGQIIRRVNCRETTFEEVKKIVTSKVDPADLPTPLVTETLSGKPGSKQKRWRLSLRPRRWWQGLRYRTTVVYKLIASIILLILYLSYRGIYLILVNQRLPAFVLRFTPRITELYLRMIMPLEKKKTASIKYIELIDLSLKNLFAKKTRAAVTIGGVSLGIAIIIFLVSLGFGLENLVISRVAGLNQLRQLEATPAVSTNISITDETLAKFAQIQNVEKLLPIINVAGKVNYQNSVFDVVIAGVQSDFLRLSDIATSAGKFFDHNELVTASKSTNVDVAAAPSESEEFVAEEQTSPAVNLVALPETDVSKAAVVNESLLKLIGMDRSQAINAKFQLTMIATQDVTAGEKIESVPVEYTIVGVVPDQTSPFMYIPITDVKLLGISKYSEVKAVAKSRDTLPTVRQQIELQGFRTESTADTVAEIEQLFSTLRRLLAIVGGIALVVAALGMFNTLTVSLLERTREVGLLKTLGMHSEEVRELFLAESMTMGLFGGLLGVVLGFLAGKLLSLILSLVAITRDSDPFDVALIPGWFAGIIIGSSIIVAVLTGYYPAKRAMRISALNALRYE